MAKAIYHGPGDGVELDGLRLERGESYLLTNEQILRVRASDPVAYVEVTEATPETALELVKIADAQARIRERAQAAADQEQRKAEDEADKLQREANERAQKAARDREETARERDVARREAAATPRKTARKES
jgi:hypothetical protein